jgi:inorganic pyrophosphatase
MSDTAEYPELQAKINATRAELDSTLASIEDKLDVKKHLTRLSEQGQSTYVRYSDQGKAAFARYSDQGKATLARYREKAEASYRDKPVPWIVGATAVGIAVLGTVAWAIFSDD